MKRTFLVPAGAKRGVCRNCKAEIYVVINGGRMVNVNCSPDAAIACCRPTSTSHGVGIPHQCKKK